MKAKHEISKSLLEVWEWKEKVYQALKDKDFQESQRYYQDGIEEAVKVLNARLVQNADGSYSMV
jgi:hypothetical protein